MASSSSLPDLTALLINLGAVIEPIIMMMQGVVAVIGLYLISSALLDFWGSSNPNLQKYMSSSTRFSLPGAFAKLFVGAMLLSVSTLEFIGIFSRTFTGDVAESRMSSSGLSYSASTSLNDQAQIGAIVILGILQVIGFTAMTKGMMTINKHYNGQSNAGLGTAFGWLIGGFLAWNMRWITEVMNNTIAPGAHVLDIFYFGT